MRPPGPTAGVERNDGDSLRHRFLANRHEGADVIGGDDDRIDLLRDETVDHRDLGFGGGTGRTGVQEIHVAEFLGRFETAVATGVKEAVAKRFDDHGDAKFVGGKCGSRQRRGERERGNQLEGGPASDHELYLPCLRTFSLQSTARPSLSGEDQSGADLDNLDMNAGFAQHRERGRGSRFVGDQRVDPRERADDQAAPDGEF